MLKDRIINKIQDFVSEYPKVVFKMEFLRSESCYGCSYSIPKDLWENNYFWDALMNLKNEVRELSPESPILFTEDDMFFTLSEKALRILPEKKLYQTSSYFEVNEEVSQNFSLNEDYSFFVGDCSFYLLAA